MPAQPRPDGIEIDRQALELRMAGRTYAAIADLVPGIGSRAAAHKAVQRAIDHLGHTGGVDELAVILARLDEMQSAVWAEAREGKPGPVGLVLKLDAQRTRVVEALDRARTRTADDGPDATPKAVDDIGQRIEDYLAGFAVGRHAAEAADLP